MKIWILADKQLLQLRDANDVVVREFAISTAKNGLGEIMGSEQTPRGRHEIIEKIGEHEPINSVFVARKLTGEIYSAQLADKNPHRDWILTRILWLNGLEPGKNQGANIDSKARYIYIHGAPVEKILTAPSSKGCINMRNEDILELFDAVTVGTEVEIVA
jgi:L,D-transpeptidase YbiS